VSAHDPIRHERARHLMMAALDGELGRQDRSELDRLLAADATLREEWARLSRVKEVTTAMGYREPPEEIWDTYWVSVYNRVERGVGWILASLGVLVVAGYGLWKAVNAFLADTGLPAFVKVAVFVAALGGLILLLSVAREKLFTRQRDPYREVKR
jgi:ferric-dicitrate binding protein FerR (iron transport regulator)